MCVMSVVMDYGRQRIPLHQWTPQTFHDFQEVLRRLDALDKKLGEPDCHDPIKAEWMREVEQRLTTLETGAKRKKSARGKKHHQTRAR